MTMRDTMLREIKGPEIKGIGQVVLERDQMSIFGFTSLNEAAFWAADNDLDFGSDDDSYWFTTRTSVAPKKEDHTADIVRSNDVAAWVDAGKPYNKNGEGGFTRWLREQGK